MIKATDGDTVKVNYTGRLADGTVFDASGEDRPLHFILGKQEVIPGFDAAVNGMYQGENKTVTIAPEQAYGDYEQRWVETVERGLFPEDLALEAGKTVEVIRESGEAFQIKIVSCDDQQVTVDGNHPLAGQSLTFDIELLEVTKEPAA
ncbi:MAG: peptidylprolyl isomerase [Desulfuromonas sp.]|nr:MAG: peptidylprolyl isomerase [Desulfuromonas sp.]